MKALHKTGTWELTTLPKGERTMGCKSVFTIKHRVDGSIEIYKACLVVGSKGIFTQTYGVDFEEIFTPVAKMNSVPFVL